MEADAKPDSTEKEVVPEVPKKNEGLTVKDSHEVVDGLVRAEGEEEDWDRQDLVAEIEGDAKERPNQDSVDVIDEMAESENEVDILVETDERD